MPHFGAFAARQHQRHHAHDECDRGHQDRTQAQPAGFDRRLQRRAAFEFQFPGKFDDQDGVLAGQPDQHHQADLREDIVVAAGQPDAGQRGQDAHRDDQDHRQRQRQAFVLGSQHQEHQQHADREYPDAGIPRQYFLVGQVGPFEPDARRQRACRDPFGSGLGLRRRIAGRRAAVDVGGGVAVVAHHHFRTIAGAHLHQRRQRHHFAGGVARLQAQDVFRLRAVRRIGLHPDLEHPSEAVEVVDVQRAEVDLHGVEHIGHGDVLLLGPDPVEFHIELRHIDLVTGKHRTQFGRRARRLDEGVGRLVERGIAERAAVLDLHLEAAHGAQAHHRRRRKDGNECLLQRAILAVERGGDCRR